MEMLGYKSGYQAVPAADSESNDVEKSTNTFIEKDPNASSKGDWVKPALLVFGAIAALTLVGKYLTSSAPPLLDESVSEFDSSKRYILRNFDTVKPMSSFLNGIGGIWGVPMWAFYVNRGQGISSFGKQNKDSAIAKFVTAEKAYQQTPFTGFRTMIKGTRGGKEFKTQPFFPTVTHTERNMYIGLNEMEISEIDAHTALQTSVLYFIAPNQDFPGLVRKMTLKNTGKDSVHVEVLDGLAKLIPNGLGNYPIDSMGRTMEAWMNVYNTGAAQDTGDSIMQPFFHISQDTADQAQVRLIKDGYFSVAYVEKEGDITDLLPFVVDPMVVFDQDTSLTHPYGFFASSLSAQDIAKNPQGTTSRTPCAFAAGSFSLAAGESVTVTSVYGYADSLETFLGTTSKLIKSDSYSTKKYEQANEIIQDIAKKVVTRTANELFDQYVQQDFIDNMLRGGLPIILGDEAKKPYHVFSRIHGDLERDYNYFQIDTTYFSQGPGNFRDVSQNRRVDTFHTPEVGDFNIRMFLTFVQADGYNPLTVASTMFAANPDTIEDTLDKLHIQEPQDGFGSRNFIRFLLSRAFRPGQFFHDLAIGGVKFGISNEEVMNVIVDGCRQDFIGQFNQNGFWSDHWTYTLDLLDSYLDIFPDEEEDFLFDTEIAFFMSPAIVRPRSARYSVINDANGKPLIRSYAAIAIATDADYSVHRNNALTAIYSDPMLLADGSAGSFYQRDASFKVFTVSPIAKLLMLGVIKFSTLDPFGMGVEYEGGKPGWNDAMNGLPGILGSGMPETYEMLRIIRSVHTALQAYPDRIVSVPSEFAVFLSALGDTLNVYSKSKRSAADDYKFWDSANTHREAYRLSTIALFTTKTDLTTAFLVDLLARMDAKVVQGIAKAVKGNGGLSPTYFYYDSSQVNYTTVDGVSKPFPTAFAQKKLPLFLEGPTRQMKIVQTQQERMDIYQKVRSSALYDESLQMYKLSESLDSMGQDVGRMKAFSPGWLENQSIWLHMSYKFYLELLRGGLYDVFFAEIQHGLVPFMNHLVYGRSPLEAASFIVSSAFPDKKLHGSSFAARLSGSTAEFLSMWAIMFAGHQPFQMDGDQLTLTLHPILPEWLFAEDNTVSFTFLGEVTVTYVNNKRLDTWTAQVEHYTLKTKGDALTMVEGPVLPAKYAQQVRDRKVAEIIVVLN